MMNDKHKVFPWMMKTNTLINTMCGLLILAACNMACSPEDDRLPGNSGNPESPEASSPSPIGFSTDASDTRGTGYGPTVLPEAIGVYASQTHGEFDGSSAMMNFMQNQKVEHNAEKNTWSYKPVKFWPEEPTDKLSFFAYAPYNATGLSSFPESTTTGYPKLNYVVTGEEASQTDLLVAPPVLNRTSGDIKFSLKHALVKVKFGLKSNEDITVKSLKLTGVKDRGTLAFDDTEKGFNWSGIIGNTTWKASIAEAGIAIPANQETAIPVTSFFMLPDKTTTKFDINYLFGVCNATQTGLSLPESPTTWTAGGVVDYTIGLSIPPDNYNGVAVGDILCAKHGSGYTVKPSDITEEDKANAVGVVFKVGPGEGDSADNYPYLSTIHGYAIALEYANEEKRTKWGTDIYLIVGTSESTSDFLGYSNTEKIKKMSLYDSTNFAVCYYATNYPVNNIPGRSSGWYLPSAGQWVTLAESLSILNNSITIVGGKSAIPTSSGAWSSTEFRYVEGGVDIADVYIMFPNLTIDIVLKTNSRYVRSCITF